MLHWSVPYTERNTNIHGSQASMEVQYFFHNSLKTSNFQPLPNAFTSGPRDATLPYPFCICVCWQLVTSSPLGEWSGSKLGKGGFKSLKCVHIHNWVSATKESTQDFWVASLRANTNNIQDEGQKKACKQITGKVAVTLCFWDWLKKELVSCWYYEALAVTHHWGAWVICFSVGPNNTVIFCLSSPLNKGSHKQRCSTQWRIHFWKKQNEGTGRFRIRQDARKTE